MNLSTGLRAAWNRLAGLVHRRELASELEEEMRFHREQLEHDSVRAGMTPAEARLAARRRFGNDTYLTEESRDMWRIEPLETVVQDIRYAMRFLRRSPAFTTVAVLSLALGIGANTAVFTLINAILVRPLPVPDPGRLVLLEPSRNGVDTAQNWAYGYFKALDTADVGLDGMFALRRAFNMSLDRGNGSEPIGEGGLLVTGKYFSTLGVRPALGRLLGPEDDRIVSGHPVMVLSHDYWMRAFGADSAAVGRTVRVNRTPLTIVGVAPPGFFGTQAGERPDVYLPLMMAGVPNRGDERQLSEPGNWWLRIMGRLAPGETRESAAAKLSLVFRREMTTNPPSARADAKARAGWARSFVAVTDASIGLSTLRRRFEKPLLILACMSGVLLLIACTNLGSLLAARAAARRREIAIRLAMGAGRRRLVRQLLTESLILAAAGAIGGLVFAYGADRALLALAARGRAPLWLAVTPDLRVLAFTAAIAALTGILFGIAPALQSTRVELSPSLRQGGGAGRGHGTIRLGKILVATQVALSVLLLFGASLFVRSLQRLYSTELGFRPADVVMFHVDPRRNGYRGSALASVYHEIIARTAAVPGVLAATTSSHTPFSGAESSFDGKVDGFTHKPDEPPYIVRVITAPNYFEAMGVPLRRGRYLTGSDAGSGGGPRVAVVNESFARKYFGDREPLGRRFYRGGNDSTGVEIVGVVADARFNSFRDSTPTIASWSFASDTVFPGPAQTLFVRVDPRVPTVLSSIRAAIKSIDRNIEVLAVRPMDAQIDASITNERMVASLSGFFGIFALILAMIGLYGLMAYAVTSRTRELGIRIALGAAGGRVGAAVMREALVLVAIGIAIGAPVALAASRVAKALLYGMTPTDVPTMALATGLLVVVAAIAAAIPAWRASRIDPVTMLRSD